ncbi:MAG: zinc ABC transporter substrate-binding protein [Turicibacter sp.]|nr:zinc ABC transporter substrate-binding protein [Turicibacter sp.]
MRKIILIFVVGVIFSSCNFAEDGDTPTVYTSFYAMYDFTRTIAGDIVDVVLLLPPGADTHHFEPSAQDMVNISNSALFIYHGFGMEHYIDSIRNAITSDTVFIEASAGVEPALQDFDPHLWLNPMYALRMKENITVALIGAFPNYAETFHENLIVATERILDLQEAHRLASANFVRRTIVVSHGAFGHLSHFLGITQVSITGVGAHTEPSPARMAELIDFVLENGITTIFYDKDSTLAEVIAAETGANVAMLDTFEGLTDGDYFTIMQRNLDALIEALS